MGQEEDKINDLEKRYRELWDRHQALKEEIRTNYAEFKAWKEGTPISSAEKPETVESPTSVEEKQSESVQSPKKEKHRIDWEHFVGEKLLARIGIAIVLIGVAIGVKYAIDHQLIGVGLRISGGYLVGATLGFLAFRLHKKYEAFSAILASGALGVVYFMTYAGYAFYNVFPLWMAYGGMLLTVIITVLVALWMNRVIIAHLGLLGAYLLPPLVTTGNQHISYYLGYMLLINLGVLVISFLRSWKSLFIPIQLWSVAIFLFWFLDDYITDDAWLATVYIWLFYAVIALGIRARNLRYKQPLEPWENVQLLVLAAVAFLGLNACGHHTDMLNLISGLIPLLISGLFWWNDRKNLVSEAIQGTDLHMVFAMSALVLLPFSTYYASFVCLLAGTTLVWWSMFTRVELIRIFATIIASIAGVVVITASFSRTMGHHTEVAWLNDFVLGLCVVIVFHIALYRYYRAQFTEEHNHVYVQINTLIATLVAAVSGFMIIRYAGNLELAQLKNSEEPITIFTNLERLDVNKAKSYLMLGFLWMALVMAFVIWYRKVILRLEKGYRTGMRITYLLGLLLMVAAVSYLNAWADDFEKGDTDWRLFEVARYGFFTVLGFIGWFQWRSMRESNWELALGHVVLLWMLSLELIHWSLIWNMGVGYKLLLSLLWGTYAVFLLLIGINLKNAVLRITALSILGVMLMKLFFYDLTMLSTITKTLVFLLVGGLLLVGGYFYQRLSKQQEE